MRYKSRKSQGNRMLTYKDSGVNIDEGNALVDKLKLLVKTTFDTNVIGGIGSFSGVYALPSGYKEPVLLAATDGVGTKLRLAIESCKLSTIGIDLVAMCVNDLICNFASPMFFLDYYATGKLHKDQALRVIEGIVEGCKIAECALIGGESAEMPGMYAQNDFDLAGFAVGIAEKSEVQAESKIKQGDVLIALPSSGLHSNGYSLARKILFETLKMKFDDMINGTPLIDVLLAPTNIYVKTFKHNKHLIKARAHITGGGIIENLPRILPQGFGAHIQTSLIPKQEIFNILSQHIDKQEAYRVFNMGVGMIFALPTSNVDVVLRNTGGFAIGEIVEGETIRIID